jgi:hypothetical protein
MKGPDIHVIPKGTRDWLVREAGGRELGHYATQSEAEAVGAAVARKRKGELVMHSQSGIEERRGPARSVWGRLLGRG